MTDNEQAVVAVDEGSVGVGVEPWGWSFLLDCRFTNHWIKDKEMIADFAKELVKRIDMEAHGEPIIEMFGDGNKRGYTLVQLIKTSSITCHFCEETLDMYLDVFSCKKFEQDVVCDVVRDFFNPYFMRKQFTYRLA